MRAKPQKNRNENKEWSKEPLGKGRAKGRICKETGVRIWDGEDETGGEETQLKQILPGDVVIIPNILYSN